MDPEPPHDEPDPEPDTSTTSLPSAALSSRIGEMGALELATAPGADSARKWGKTANALRHKASAAMQAFSVPASEIADDQPPWEDLKEKGNERVVQNKPEEAARMYTEAVELTSEEPSLYMNRAFDA